MFFHKGLQPTKVRPIQCIDKSLNIQFSNETTYVHGRKGLVEMGLKKLKGYKRTNLWDGCTLNKYVLGRSLKVMRTTVHSRIEESPFKIQNEISKSGIK